MSLDIVTFKSAPIEIIDGDRGKNYPKQDEFTDEGYCLFLNAKNITENGFNFDTKMFISEEKDNLLRKGKLQKGDVILTTRGTVGNVAFYSEHIPYNNIRINSGMLILRSKQELDNEFLYWTLKSNYFKKQIYTFQSGTAQPQLPISSLKHIEFYLPPINIQKKIVKILSQIDNKIRILKYINKNLEQLIKYIYINWFEEFEPFKDKDFYDTKLGSIPVGWDVKPLQEFIKFQEGPGIRNWQYVEEDGINFLNIRCIQNNDLVLDTANMISKEEANGKYAHFMLNEWDLVISSSGTLGRYAIVREEHLPLCLNTSIIRFTPMHSFDHYAYVYSYLTSRGFYHYLLTMGSGSVQLNFGPTHLKQIDLIVPPENILKKYNDLIFPLIEQMVTIKSEISKLTKLRDTLLPKLMSGEIDVSKINCDLELKYNYMKYLFNQIHTPMSKSVV